VFIGLFFNARCHQDANSIRSPEALPGKAEKEGTFDVGKIQMHASIINKAMSFTIPSVIPSLL
jgi:hypothetical protein